MLKKIGITLLAVMLVLSLSITASAESDWVLTQYADLSGNQAMCYSLVSGDDLILIDGGWTENAPQVREIIENNGGHVRAWFLTHYHNDYCGAFNALWEYEDIANNCSLILKFTSSEQSILFLGDVWKKDMGMELLELYGIETMQANYIQAGHHGNNTQSFEFYKALNPSVIFLNGPEWLMTGENYDAKNLIVWCVENEITTYDYRQAPTMFIL